MGELRKGALCHLGTDFVLTIFDTAKVRCPNESVGGLSPLGLSVTQPISPTAPIGESVLLGWLVKVWARDTVEVDAQSSKAFYTAHHNDLKDTVRQAIRGRFSYFALLPPSCSQLQRLASPVT